MRRTGLIAKDWRRLAGFYQDVFGCVPVPPERDMSGEWLHRATGLPGAHLRGVHLRPPGHGDWHEDAPSRLRSWHLIAADNASVGKPGQHPPEAPS